MVSGVERSAQTQINQVATNCIDCNLCQAECQFLKKYGTPKKIAEAYDPSEPKYHAMAFECSLCRLCDAVCPAGITPSEMFHGLRRKPAGCEEVDYPRYSAMLNYEKRGTSKRYTYYAIPGGCDTVFFPGCSLPGTRPKITLALYRHMQKSVPALGIVLDCCTKPSLDLGRQAYFQAMFQEMRDFLLQSGVGRVLVACPNCHKVFRSHGEPLVVQSVYEFMAENGAPDNGRVHGIVTIHDPCPVRYEPSIHAAVRKLCGKSGLGIIEMPHHGSKSLCCGEGGAVDLISPEIAKAWVKSIQDEAQGNRVITYCAGCVGNLNRSMSADHLIDLVFDPKTVMAGKTKYSRAPVTYYNRLMLKRRIRKTVMSSVAWERTLPKGYGIY